MSQKYRKVHHTTAPAADFPFRNQLMVCAICKRLKFRGEESTDWRSLQADDERYMICARHFPPDEASSEAFAEAYARVFAQLGLAGRLSPGTELEFRSYQ